MNKINSELITIKMCKKIFEKSYNQSRLVILRNFKHLIFKDMNKKIKIKRLNIKNLKKINLIFDY